MKNVEQTEQAAMDHILIVDDDTELCDLVTRYLNREGFHVSAVHNGIEGVNAALSGDYLLIVLDVMLPGLSGFDVLRRIHAEADTPVLMLTARGDDVDRIVGLEIGADDYLPKPFNPRELVARIRAILRRTRSPGVTETKEPAAAASPAELLRVGDLEMDVGARIVRRGGVAVELTGAEFDLLTVLLRGAGQVITREDLVRSVLGRSFMAYDRSIDTLVSNLRRKLGHEIEGIERIRSVRGIGYVYARVSDSHGP